ncbi:MAG: pyruvate formate-lyase-activating protein [Acutalibacteraceae bacterium]|nr:pyruvate formate-lyase-activating protein [Acutalibacteraceae bacterium]
MKELIKGRISSFQTLGTLDGPGVRFVAFLQGCPLRCACCHNPETWDKNGGTLYTANQVVEKAERYKEYFGKEGGITVSGGEPLLQMQFVTEIFKSAHEKGINTCLDTSGCIINEFTEESLSYTDYCLLDIKYTSDREYRQYVGCGIEKPLEFLELLNSKKIRTRIRQVIIEGLNDSTDNIGKLAEIIKKYDCIERTELLAFRKLCTSKYQKLGIDFPLADTPETPQFKIKLLEEKLREILKDLM